MLYSRVDEMNEKDLVEITINSYDEVAEEYSRFHSTESFKNRLDTFINLLSEKGLVLDAGCGCGRDTKYLLDRGIETIGIDLSQGMVDQARKYVPNAEFLQMDMRKLEFEVSTFDGILAMASVLHIPKNQMPYLLTEFRRILKANGLLYIAVMIGSGEKYVEKSAAVPEMGPRFFAFYNEKELRDILNQAGFEIKALEIDRYLGVDWINVYSRKV
jgi:ubiquinone/menaquinone biosynthesis C-methylase UbiE